MVPSTPKLERPSKLNLHFVTGTFPGDPSVHRAVCTLASRGHAVTVLAHRRADRRLSRTPLLSRVAVQLLPHGLDIHAEREREPQRALIAMARTLRAAI